jgi:transposase-like protein
VIAKRILTPQGGPGAPGGDRPGKLDAARRLHPRYPARRREGGLGAGRELRPWDEVFLRINGELHYLWRAVDQNGVVLDILVQDRRNASAAKRFFKRLLAGLRHRPKRIITDGLRSYGVAQREILPDVRHRNSRHLNNRAENSHRPTRRRSARCSGSSHPNRRSSSLPLTASCMVRPRRHLMTAAQYRRTRAKAFRTWRQETCVQVALLGYVAKLVEQVANAPPQLPAILNLQIAGRYPVR